MDRRLVELRFLQGIEKVEHVPYSSGDQFWVRFNKPLDVEKLQEVVKRHGYDMVRITGLPSKLPGKLAEVLWDGVSFVIGKNIGGLTKFKSSLGFEPDGIAKIAKDLHGPYQIFIAMDEAGIQLLYDYLDVKYVAPLPPPPKPAVPAAAKPAPVAQKPVAQLPQSTVPKPPAAQPPPDAKPVEQPQPATAPVQAKAADRQTPLKKDESEQATNQS